MGYILQEEGTPEDYEALPPKDGKHISHREEEGEVVELDETEEEERIRRVGTRRDGGQVVLYLGAGDEGKE